MSAKRKKLQIDIMSANPNHKKIEKMRELFVKDPPDIGRGAPKTCEFIDADVNELMKTNLPQYQRAFEMNRFKTAVASIIEHGLMEASIIILVKDGRKLYLHDGRHRTVACYVLGIKTIKAVLITFHNKEHEIKFFNTINQAKTGTKLEQRMLNNFQADEPYETLIYDLGCMDPDSKWSDMVALNGVENKKEKMSVSNFCKVVNWAGLGLRRRLEGETQQRAIKKMKVFPYEQIRENVNDFHEWFYNFARPIKVKGDEFHKEKVLISMLEFYYCSLRQNSKSKLLTPAKILKKSLTSFKTYNFTRLANSGWDSKSAPDDLFKHFNGKPGKHPLVRI